MKIDNTESVTLLMRVNVEFGFDCSGRCMDKSEEFEIPISQDDKQLLENLPSCEDGKTTDLQSAIPADLYKRLRDAAFNKVEDIVFEHGFRNGAYELDVHKWFERDLKNQSFCKIVGIDRYKIEGKETIFNSEDDEFFEYWLDLEDKRFEEQGVKYIRSIYEKELKEQTDFSSINWSMEF